ncbi:MAG: GntR family transcriptional regulator [Lachnospiraceae bacterium]|jgi:GntR family transcriptional regulator|uniref:GntR family transcriptional regulator n=1 Tax=Clostridium sp. (strain SY8519) TaxID=1042156 RepID=UPI000217214B|nr:GntR family transcriptional regulator [Clostridium sp. SY8519]MCI1655377.1 GntR family transcriptional regulator [Lachnospiraceae bacterium]MCI1657708.1 GntR family transcriptional regulator [Lachnospiraceae bacterium]MCI2196124.1 GntR family transcriptional regulator [Lachnospiraceae bacterium]BAK46838.1 hypothetical protein CXIVA_08710 [Clostridium sp. SY8519]
MTWKLDDQRSIYRQLIDEIERRIITGVYAPGSRLGSVRDLANEAGVNPNTMQRALTELERTGLVYSMRTSGRFVTDDEEQIRSRKIMTAREAVEHFMRQMYELGLEKEEVLALIRDNQPEAQGQGGK